MSAPDYRYNAADQLRDCAPDVLNGKALYPSVWDSILNTMGKWRVNIATPKGRARAARDMLAKADALDRREYVTTQRENAESQYARDLEDAAERRIEEEGR